jgi:hypothetical protein
MIQELAGLAGSNPLKMAQFSVEKIQVQCKQK